MFRETLFKVIVENKVLERFDVSHEFWEQFGVRDVKTRKNLGLFETEHIDDPCQVTIAVNPKEYILKNLKVISQIKNIRVLVRMKYLWI